MKEVKTNPSKTYVVTTANGCTVTTEDGLTLAEIEAGKQGGFVAIDSKVLLSDDSACLTPVFKLAPYQKLRLLGVVGGADGLPAGYTPLEYLESTGTQGILVMTPINKLSMLGLFSLTKRSNSLYKVWGTWYAEDSIYQMVQRNATSLEIQVGSGVAANLPNDEKLLAKMDYFDRKAFLNGSVIFDGFTMPATSDTVRFGILCAGTTNSNPTYFAYARFYNLKLWDENVLTYDLVPALDPTGEPCVCDLVSKQAFKNSGTGQFIAGIATVDDVRKLWLPETGGTLTLSVPADTPDSAVEQLRQNNPTWQIAIQYRTDNEN